MERKGLINRLYEMKNHPKINNIELITNRVERTCDIAPYSIYDQEVLIECELQSLDGQLIKMYTKHISLEKQIECVGKYIDLISRADTIRVEIDSMIRRECENEIAVIESAANLGHLSWQRMTHYYRGLMIEIEENRPKTYLKLCQLNDELEKIYEEFNSHTADTKTELEFKFSPKAKRLYNIK